LLLKQPGININHANVDGFTALTEASFNNHTEIVELLLKQPGSNVNHARINDITASISAMEALLE
jgi:ankyrin repeat protein